MIARSRRRTMTAALLAALPGIAIAADIDPTAERFRNADCLDTGEHNVTIETEGQEKTYCFRAGEAGYLYLTVPDAPRGLSFRSTIYDEDGNKLDIDQARLPGKGRYFLILSDRWNDFASEMPFTVRIRFAPETDPSEPDNNEMATARPVEPGPLELAIAPLKDVDYLRLRVPGPGYLSVAPKESIRRLSLRARILNAEGEHLDTNEARLPAGGEYFVAVSDRWGKYSDPSPFVVEALYTPETDEREPNDTAEQAAAARTGRNEVVTAPEDDVDVYSFEITEPGYLDLSVPNPPRGYNPAFEVRTPEGALLGRQQTQVHYIGDVFITVKDRWGKYSGTDPFEWRLEFTPQNDLFEPNDTPATAIPVELGGWYSAVLGTPEDIDAFRVNVPHDGALEIRTEDEAPDHRSGVWDAQAREWRRGHIIPVSAGTRTIGIWPYSGFSRDPFRFSIRLLKTRDEFSVTGEPLTVELDQAYLARLTVPGESRRFRLKLDEERMVTLTTEGVTPFTPRFRYEDAAGREYEAAAPLVLRLGPGNHEFQLSPPRQAASERPFLVVARTADTPLPDNHTRETAQPIDFGAAAAIASPDPLHGNWFRFDAPEAGTVVILVTSDAGSEALERQRPALKLHTPDGKVKQLEPLPEEQGLSFAPLAVSAGQHHIHVTQSPDMLELMPKLTVLYRPVSAPARKPSNIFVTGIELDDEVARRFGDTVATTGGQFMTTADAEDLAANLETVVRTAVDERGEALSGDGRGWAGALIAILGLLAAMAIGARYWRRRTTPSKRASQEGS